MLHSINFFYFKRCFDTYQNDKKYISYIIRKYIFAILFTICTLFNFSSCVDIEYPNPPGNPQVVQIFYGNWTPGQTNAFSQYMIGGYTTGQTRAAMTRAAVSQTYNDKFSL